MTPDVIQISGLSKEYHGLRPLRIDELTVAEGEHIAILGLDQPMAEMFVNLVIGAALPERGSVSIFGRPTSAIDGSDEWLKVVDQFGMVSARAVLLDALSVIQNLSIPFTLDIDPPPDTIRERAVRLAREAGLPQDTWPRAVSDLDGSARLRLRLARALALEPKVLLLEHASAGLPRNAATTIGSDIRRVASRRGCAIIAAGVDEPFATAVAARVLTLDPASGRLSERRRSLFKR